MMALLEWLDTSPKRTLREAVTLGSVKAVGVSVAVAATLLATLVASDLDRTPAPGPERSQSPVAVDRTVAMIARFRCSTTGFANDLVPASALVRRGGVVRQVSFDAGWATYRGTRPGTLVAVCRAPLAR